jgi:AcrR family transcriptional regulator
MKQAEKRQLTRGKVLQAAEGVFARRGYHEASLREIASKAGVSKGALYYNFASKEDLFLALLEVRMEERLGEIRIAFEDAEEELEGAAGAAAAYLDNLARNREWITLFFEFVAYAARGGEFGDRFAERFGEFWTALGEIVEQRSRERGLELPLPARELAIALDLLGIGFMLPPIVDPDAVSDDLLGKAIGYLLRGVAAASREGGDQDA